MQRRVGIRWPLALTAAATMVTLALAPQAALARDGTVTSFDGTKIAYSFFPAPNLQPGQRAPTLLNGPGYSVGRASSSDAVVQAALNDGYNVLTWDPRGFGSSGGNVELDSPTFEGRDVSALIDTVAQQPEVALDKPGDPRLGMIGASYGGGIQITAAAIDPRIDAITPQIAWHSLVTSLSKDNTAKSGWGSLLYTLGTEGSSTGAAPGTLGPGGRQDPRVTTAFNDGLATGEFSAADQAFFAAAGPGDAYVGRIHVPTLLMEGTDDTLFTLHEAIQNYAILRRNHVPVQMLWFCGGLTGGPVAHGVCNTSQGPDPSLDTHYALRWLDRWVKDQPSLDTGPRFSWVSDDGVLHGGADYPLAQDAPVTATGSGSLVMVTGDTSGALIEAQPAANAIGISIPTPPQGTEMVGEPSLTLTYTGTSVNADGRLYAQLVDNRSHLVLGNQVTPIPVTLDGQPHSIQRLLEGVAVDVTPGKSYTLQITDGTSDYFPARYPGTVQVSATLSIPTVAGNASGVVSAPVSVHGSGGGHGGSSRKCATRRLSFRLSSSPRMVKVYVDGRLKLVRLGRRVSRVTLLVRDARAHRIRVDSFAGKGRLLRRSSHRLAACGRR